MNAHPKLAPVCAALLGVILVVTGAIADSRKKVGDGPSHGGGVIYVARTGGLPDGALVGDCLSFPRPRPEEADLEIPLDGVPYVCVVYAAFPEADSVDLTGVTFGIDYDPSIQLVGYGYCSGDGVLLSTPDWPKPGSGMAMTIAPRPTENPTPLVWFVLSATEPGAFRIVPHPMARHAGRFSNFDPVPYLEPVTGYGFLGAGQAGSAPSPGERETLGICCLDRCLELTAYECAYYSGLYLGPGSCAPSTCAEEGELGACCLRGGCEIATRKECYRSGGAFGGEGSRCEDTPCEESR